ncbi:hypothetical protein GUJ93_ZPchr0008g12412 [Zizania palustris]|uniref:Cysteine proteinase inhibitor n=1 Tax=Zizania palustris TaxID=103762 RepID=A0A8J5QWN6_ZIZPA|nr:hypothetical protein GUJ93_ZPchr0008g12412 [Zizania palustris]
MRVAATTRPAPSPSATLLLLLAVAVAAATTVLLVGAASLAVGAMAGHGSAAANSAETDALARFAVDEHNKRENALLEFVRVVEAKEQVVVGTLHHLTLEAIEAGRKRIYDAKVLVKPWLDFKELQEFRHTGDATSSTNADLGANKGGQDCGWRDVPVNDPVVKDAADHAVKLIQQRSNSLFPYELLEIIRAKAEVVEDHAKFDILMKLKRGTTEEKFKVEVHKNLEGAFVLNQMQQEPDE